MIKIASLFGIGYLPKAPGTWGSAFSVIFAYLFFVFGRTGFALFCVALLVAFIVGLRSIHIAQSQSGEEDPKWVVIDELVGQWIALIPVGWAMAQHGVLLWPGFISAFLLFRLFDIRKPWIVGWADRRGDALGVMLDDVFAGVFAAIGTALLGWAWHAAF